MRGKSTPTASCTAARRRASAASNPTYRRSSPTRSACSTWKPRTQWPREPASWGLARAVNGEHWTHRGTNDFLCDAAEKRMRKACSSVRADDDEIGRHLVGDGVNLLPCDALTHDRREVDAVVRMRLAQVFRGRLSGSHDARGHLRRRDHRSVREAVDGEFVDVSH